MNNCLFCKIIAGEIPCYELYQDNNFIVILDIHPVNLGHALIIPKQHYKNILDLPSDILTELGPLMKKISITTKESRQADGINIIMNNETPAGQVIDHAHIHIIPRFINDGLTNWLGQDDIEKEQFTKIQQQFIKSLK